MKLGPKYLAFATIIVYWSPFNSLHYTWGFFLLFFILLFKKKWLLLASRTVKNIIFYSVVLFLLFIVSFIINYFIINSSFNNLLWSIITYGSTFSILISFLLIPLKKQDIKSVVYFSVYVTLFQIVVGYFQMLDSINFQSLNPFVSGTDAGDNFVGTTFDVGIGNLVAIKISLVLLLLLPFWFSSPTWKKSLLISCLLFGWVLASALYTLLLGFLTIAYFFFIKVFIVNLLRYKLTMSIFSTLIILIVAITFFVITQPDNIQYVQQSLKSTYSTAINSTEKKETVRKVVYYRNSLIELPWKYPQMLFIGVGPGNYSSRSAWIVSGEYLLTQPFYIPITPSEVARKYSISLWSKRLKSDDFKGAGSISQQPFSTWISVLTELGLISLFLFLLIFRTFYKAMVRVSSFHKDPFITKLATGVKISIAYILLLFFVDNLFEWPMVMGQLFILAGTILRISNKL